MPAKSKKQQMFMGMVHAFKQGKLGPGDVSEAVRKAASGMSDKSARDFAKTKRSRLPTRVKKSKRTKK